MRRRRNPLQTFLQRESAGGILLVLAAVVGLGIANSPLGDRYFSVLNSGFEVGGGLFYLKLTTLKVINYILMTFFFFVVGLEIKRELTTGHLSNFRAAVMPLLGALGGMVFPAAIYLMIAGKENAEGWGVPVATDIALAVGLLTIIGAKVATSLRTFLLGLAVIDDIGAILIIAFIYSNGVGIGWVAASVLTILLISVAKKLEVSSTGPYILFGLLLWYSLYRSGIHPTLSGVILGLLTPKFSGGKKDSFPAEQTLIERLEERLHPWSSFLIVPLFAFANTGVIISLASIKNAVSSPIAWGIFFGLVIGKPLGIIVSVYLAKKSNIGDYPHGAKASGLLATGSAAGIGFTVAIFIADLAFKSKGDQDVAVLAVIVASVVSGLLSLLLFTVLAKKQNDGN